MPITTPLPPRFLMTTMDPGLTTGLTLFHVAPDKVQIFARCAVRYDPATRSTPVDRIMSWAIDHHDLPHVLLYEDFHIRPHERSVDPTPLRVIGGMEDRLMPFGAWSGPRPAPMLQEAVQRGAEARLAIVDDMVLRTDEMPASPYVRVVKQEPVQGKLLVPNEILERLGFLAHGTDSTHMNDSTRHGVSFLAVNRHPWICAKGWPRPGITP